MKTAPIWFERKFEFTFPVELYPNLCARLRGTPARLEETVRNSSRELLIRQTPGKWSAQEHAGHLPDLESLWLARIEDFVRGGSELTAADLSNRRTHEMNHNERSVDDILGAFRQARAGLMKTLEAIDPEILSRAILHPRLKQPMRLVDHLYFVAEHDDHHLAWIWQSLNVGAQVSV
jgi:uncharacterized damage-inducible protein DinB